MNSILNGFRYEIASAAGVKERLAAFDITPSKSLGQNFLVDKNALDILVNCTADTLNIYEIGPGLGALTEALIADGKNVIAVEKDGNMVQVLNKTISSHALTVIHGDALKIGLTDIGDMFYKSTGSRAFAVAANLPYYITTKMSEILLNAMPKSITLTIQSEAAERFFSLPGERVYGPLAVIASLFYKCERLMELSCASFYPEPGVSSRIVSLLWNGVTIPTEFYKFLNGAFAMRRKTLLNNLKRLGYFEAQAHMALEYAKVNKSARAESVCPASLLSIYNGLNIC